MQVIVDVGNQFVFKTFHSSDFAPDIIHTQKQSYFHQNYLCISLKSEKCVKCISLLKCKAIS